MHTLLTGLKSVSQGKKIVYVVFMGGKKAMKGVTSWVSSGCTMLEDFCELSMASSRGWHVIAVGWPKEKVKNGMKDLQACFPFKTHYLFNLECVLVVIVAVWFYSVNILL
jgi:hypothetical protein